MDHHHNRLTKAYKGLNPDQLAALAFHYTTDANELEFERIAAAVPLKEYRCPDVIYQAKLDNLTWFAAHWTIEYWKLRCRKSEALGGAVAALRRGEHEKADELIETHEYMEQCLLALDAALATVCAERNIDPADVRKVSGAKPFKPRREDLAPDAEVQAAMLTGFRELLRPNS